ncbi:unnamed protein product [Paramecium primaurelia]|uniref:Uncharacterized protein n=2 Tax=Paramecium TaxID=5884 RepID=A0A8S1SP89_9CILI|nr:unnamed protein product [Paramecium primaurelia]CAD8141608.1 unnamed protein product [Paramecium pentaurelia]
MGNYCITEMTIEEDNEAFAKSSVQASNLNKIFSSKYKMEADEDCLSELINQIEPGFSAQFEIRKKRNMSGTHFESATQYKDGNQKLLKPSLKQISHVNSLQREHSNKTVRWDSQCYSSDSLKQ